MVMPGNQVYVYLYRYLYLMGTYNRYIKGVATFNIQKWWEGFRFSFQYHTRLRLLHLH